MAWIEWKTTYAIEWLAQQRVNYWFNRGYGGGFSVQRRAVCTLFDTYNVQHLHAFRLAKSWLARCRPDKKTLHLICNTHEHNFKALDIGIQNSAECIPVKIRWTKSHITFETFGYCVWHCWANEFIYNAFVRRNINFRCFISRCCPIFIGLLHFFSVSILFHLDCS